MIPLRLRAYSSVDEPYVVRLNSEARAFDLDASGTRTTFDADLVEAAPDALAYVGPRGRVDILGADPMEVDGDVLLVLPGGRAAQRLVRAASRHNTFLVTERCDQLCVMCSQPPKEHHSDWFPFFEAAALLAPPDMTLGISGGEPTLFKSELLPMMERVLRTRPDLVFHVLSNGQHLDEGDMGILARLPRDRVVWGIPLYAAGAYLHDDIVGKAGAFERLTETFSLLCRAGAVVELRTVVMKSNVASLKPLAHFVATHLPFIGTWALMQLENIGFGRKNWEEQFLDTSREFAPIAAALAIARSRGINAVLYNFPRCTVPAAYRELAPSTISDWKRRYLEDCANCPEKEACGGFFEWYPEDRGFKRLGLQ